MSIGGRPFNGIVRHHFMERELTCPECRAAIAVHTVGGMDSDTPMPCDSCAEVLWVNGGPKFLSPLYRLLVRPPFVFFFPLLQFLGITLNPYSKRYFERLSKSLPRCECGGQFRRDSQNHCPKCRAPLPIEEIRRQLNWDGDWGPQLYINQYRVHHPKRANVARNDA
jgi:hypothetical protein